MVYLSLALGFNNVKVLSPVRYTRKFITANYICTYHIKMRPPYLGLKELSHGLGLGSYYARTYI